MNSLKAYYDGVAFVPFEPCVLPKGEVVTLSIVRNASIGQSQREKLAMFKQLTDELRELNKKEPLPPEFDEILSCRVHFEREVDL